MTANSTSFIKNSFQCLTRKVKSGFAVWFCFLSAVPVKLSQLVYVLLAPVLAKLGIPLLGREMQICWRNSNESIS